MSKLEDRIDMSRIDLLARAIAAGKDVREMLMLAAHLGAEAAGNGATDLIDASDPVFFNPSPATAAAMDSALRRYRANERREAHDQSEAIRQKHNLPSRARVI